MAIFYNLTMGNQKFKKGKFINSFRLVTEAELLILNLHCANALKYVKLTKDTIYLHVCRTFR